MTDTEHDVIVAKAEAARARARLHDTIAQLRARLTPKALAEDAADSARQGALKLGMTSLETARRRPALVGGIAGLALGLLFWRARDARRSKASSEGREDDRHAQ